MAQSRSIPRILFWSAWALVPIFVLRGEGVFDGAIYGKWYFALLLSVLGLLWLVWKRAPLACPRFVLPAILILAIELLTALYAPNTGRILETALKMGAVVAVLLLVTNSSFDGQWLRRFLIPPVAITVIGALSAIHFRYELFYAGFMSSAVGFRNWVPIFLTASIPCFVGWRSRLSGFFIAASVYVIAIYRTRSAWWMLALCLAATGALALTRSPQAKRLFLRFVVAGAVAVAAASVIPNRLHWKADNPYWESVTTLASVEHSSGRDKIWKVALEMFKDHPWRGAGAGHFKVYFSSYISKAKIDPRVTQNPNYLGSAMNDYIEAGVELGLLGFLLSLAFFVGTPALMGFKLFKLPADEARLQSLYISITPLILAADALVDYPFHRAETLVLFCGALGVIGKQLTPSSLWRPRATQALACAVSVLLAFVLVGRGISQFYENRAYHAGGVDAILRARRFWPWHLRWSSNDKILARMRAGELPDAARFANDALRLWPVSPQSHLCAVAYYESIGNFSAAIDHYRVVMSFPIPSGSPVLTDYAKMISRPDFPQSVARLSDREISHYAELTENRKSVPAANDLAWSSAQSWIDVWKNRPIFSANWSGPYRPYQVIANGVQPLLSPATAVDSELDLMSPKTISDDWILLESRKRRGPDRFSLVLLNTRSGAITSLTPNPNDDNGPTCVDTKGTQLSWRLNRLSQNFATLKGDGSIGELRTSPQGFAYCTWTDSHTLLGVRGHHYSPTLFACNVDKDVACQPTKLLDGYTEFTKFLRTRSGAIGFIAIAPSEDRRRAFLINGDVVSPVPGLENLSGEVDDYDGTVARIGDQGRAWIEPGGADHSGIVHFMKSVDGAYYSIYSAPDVPRTLARLEGKEWAPFTLPVPDAPAAPSSVNIKLEDGLEVPAFYFGPKPPSKVVIWWHGGPKENISPRYNPYYHWLVSQGFGVLAVNYPGSTGLGKAYEDAFDVKRVVFSVRAALEYARSMGAQKIVSWSVSTGSQFQTELLKNQMSVTAIVDQAGGVDPKINRALATASGIQYFGIHGRYDYNPSQFDAYDYVFDAGHDLTQMEDFQVLTQKLQPFFDRL